MGYTFSISIGSGIGTALPRGRVAGVNAGVPKAPHRVFTLLFTIDCEKFFNVQRMRVFPLHWTSLYVLLSEEQSVSSCTSSLHLEAGKGDAIILNAGFTFCYQFRLH